MRVEYELDQWEWQGTTQSIDVDPQDYEGKTADQIKVAVYEEIWRDAEQNLHFIYAEDDVAQEILDAIQSESTANDDEQDDAD